MASAAHAHAKTMPLSRSPALRPAGARGEEDCSTSAPAGHSRGGHAGHSHGSALHVRAGAPRGQLDAHCASVVGFESGSAALGAVERRVSPSGGAMKTRGLLQRELEPLGESGAPTLSKPAKVRARHWPSRAAARRALPRCAF